MVHRRLKHILFLSKYFSPTLTLMLQGALNNIKHRLSILLSDLDEVNSEFLRNYDVATQELDKIEQHIASLSTHQTVTEMCHHHLKEFDETTFTFFKTFGEMRQQIKEDRHTLFRKSCEEVVFV